MNGHGCIKFLLAVLVLAVIYFGWVITARATGVAKATCACSNGWNTSNSSFRIRSSPPPRSTRGNRNRTGTAGGG